MSPETAIAVGKLGGLGVLNLEGLWTRYEDPSSAYDEIGEPPGGQRRRRVWRIYSEPIKPELITARLQQIRDAGVPVAGALSPQRTQEFSDTVIKAGVDLFVIRGTTVSAEPSSRTTQSQAVHLRPRCSRHRRWSCHLHCGPASHAHRSGWGSCWTLVVELPRARGGGAHSLRWLPAISDVPVRDAITWMSLAGVMSM